MTEKEKTLTARAAVLLWEARKRLGETIDQEINRLFPLPQRRRVVALDLRSGDRGCDYWYDPSDQLIKMTNVGSSSINDKNLTLVEFVKRYGAKNITTLADLIERPTEPDVD